MKYPHHTVLFFSLIALIPTHALAQTSPIKLLKNKDAKIEVNPPQMKSIESPKFVPEKEVQTIVSEDELKELGIGYAFDGKSFVFTGSVSKLCAEKLSSEVKKETTQALTSDTVLDKIDDLNDHTSKVGGRLTFHGTKQLSSLSACQKLNEDEERIDLSKVGDLKRSILSDDEVAFAGVLNTSNKIVLPSEAAKSEPYKKLEAQIKVVDCADCTNPKKNPSIFSKLVKFDVRIIAAMFPKVMEESLKDFDTKINAANSKVQLEKVRDQMVELAKQAYAVKADPKVKEDYLGQIAAKFESLLARNEEIGFESKNDSQAAGIVDFKSQTYLALSELPGMSEESKEKALELSKSYAKGGDQRIEYLSLIRPEHKEIDEELKKRSFKQSTLSRAATNACANDQNPFAPSPQCSAAILRLQEFTSKSQALQQRSSSVKNMNATLFANWQNPSSQTSFRNVNNLFTLNPSVFPKASELNQNSGIYTNNPSYARYSPYGNQYDLVYNQAYNNPYMNRGQVNINPNTLPTAIPINPGDHLPFPTNSGTVQNRFQPTFVINDSMS